MIEGIGTPIQLHASASNEPDCAPWTPAVRLAFRITFLYFSCFVLLGANGTLLGVIPTVGGWVQDRLNWPINHLSEFVGQHLFHLTGIAAHWHPSDSGDTALNWIHDGLLLTTAIVGGIIWTFLSHLGAQPRTDYRTLQRWLRFFLRLTCGMFMVGYGLVKVFPFQMPPPSVAILNESAGNMAPMTFLWNLIGLSPTYEFVCGAAELLGGALLLYRRTALAGALFSTFVLTNVVLYNFCYDVPVKLFAVNLLLGCVVLAIPDSVALTRFFWNHTPTAPTSTWAPPAGHRAARAAIVATELALAVTLLVVRPVSMFIGFRHLQTALRTPSPFVGAWHVETRSPASGAFVDPKGLPITDLYVAPANRAYTRSADGQLWLSGLNPDTKKQTVLISCYFMKGPTNYAWRFLDADHIVLTSVQPTAIAPNQRDGPPQPAQPFTPTVVNLARTPSPTHYPLLERGFHFVNEWRYER